MKKVIIIGSGAAGLAAASKLIENGLPLESLILLEAQNRIGGRIHTVIKENSALELGAQWVHGVKGNVVYTMGSEARELNTSIHTLESAGFDDNVVFSFEDSTLTPEQTGEFFEVWDGIRKIESNELKESHESYGEYLTKTFQEKIEQGVFKTMNDATIWSMVNWFHLLTNIIDGSNDWMETSGSGHEMYHECEGDPLVTWKRGYSSLFDILMRNLPKQKNGLNLPLSERILLGKIVHQINWDSKKENDGQQFVRINCEDGSVYECDFVIVTCSLGFLKHNADQLFLPRLPLPKRNAIKALGFGIVDKIYLEFEKPWWNSAWGGVSFLRHEEGLSDEWSDNLLGFYTVRNHPNLLIAWISGAAAQTAEALPQDQLLQACSQRLKRHVHSQFVYSEPIAVIRSLWYLNPYICGSYSYRSMESQEANAWACDLAEPVSDSSGLLRLFFAGEATHDHFYSTVHGAVETGYREADRITEIINSSHSSM